MNGALKGIRSEEFKP